MLILASATNKLADQPRTISNQQDASNTCYENKLSMLKLMVNVVCYMPSERCLHNEVQE